MNDVEDFQRRVGRNDYVQHKWFLGLTFAGAVVGIVLCDWLDLPMFGIALGAPFAVLAGMRAISGKQTAFVVRYTRSLANPVHVAYLNGAVLILVGVFFVIVEAHIGRERYLKRVEKQAQAARGEIDREIPTSMNELAVGEKLVCVATDYTVYCMDPDLATPTPVNLSHRGGAHVAVRGDRIAWTNDQQISVSRLLGEKSENVASGRAGRTVTAIALGESNVVVVAESGLEVAAISDGDLELRTVASELHGDRLLLAADDEQAWVARDGKCALWRFSLDRTEASEPRCLEKTLDVCAMALGQRGLYATTKSGELLKYEAGGAKTELGRFPGVCGVGVANGRLAVVAHDGVHSLAEAGGPSVRLLERKDRVIRPIAGASSPRFYWLEATTLKSVFFEPKTG